MRAQDPIHAVPPPVDAAALRAWLDNLPPFGLIFVSGAIGHPDAPDAITYRLRSASDGPTLRLANVARARLDGGRIRHEFDGGFAVLADGAVAGARIDGLAVEAAGFGITFKAGSGADPAAWAEGMTLSGVSVEGIGATGRGGIKFDGNTRGVIVSDSAVSGMHRSTQDRIAHSYGVAGALSDPPNAHDSYAVAWLGCLSWRNAGGAAFHAEDATRGVSWSWSISLGDKQGIEIILDHGPIGHRYVGDIVADCPGYFVEATGKGGSLRDSVIAFNVWIASAGPVVQDAHLVIGGPGSSGIYYTGNAHLDFSLPAVRFNLDGPVWCSQNQFRDVPGACYSFERDDVHAVIDGEHFASDGAIAGSTKPGPRGIVVTSRNAFRGCPVVKDRSANIIGDKAVTSGEFDASIACERLLFVADRAGWITGITRIATSAGGGGTENGRFRLLRRSPAGEQVLLDRHVSRWQTAGAATLWHGGLPDLVNRFEPGDLLFLACNGAADAPSRAVVQVDFFTFSDAV